MSSSSSSSSAAEGELMSASQLTAHFACHSCEDPAVEKCCDCNPSYDYCMNCFQNHQHETPLSANSRLSSLSGHNESREYSSSSEIIVFEIDDADVEVPSRKRKGAESSKGKTMTVKEKQIKRAAQNELVESTSTRYHMYDNSVLSKDKHKASAFKVLEMVPQRPGAVRSWVWNHFQVCTTVVGWCCRILDISLLLCLLN